MTPDPRVLDLLARYEALCEHGQAPTLQDLCQDCPELIEPVRRQLVGLAALNVVLDTEAETLGQAGDDSGPPIIPGYELLEPIGRGGMGVVYRALQLWPNRIVALKMILADHLAGPIALKLFLGEAEAIAQLEHPNIVRIYEIGEHEGRPYFTIEYLAGGTLNQRLAGTPLLARSAAELVECLARAIQAAHASSIIHRDLKPGNILFSPRSKVESPTSADLGAGTLDLGLCDAKIADFGLAKRLTVGSDLTTPGAVLGTPSYMAPEQARGSTTTGPPADIYALGAVLYETLTGRPPFRAETAAETLHQVLHEEPVPPSRLQPKLPRDLETICLKCLEKDAGRRYASAQEFADDLGRFLAGRPIVARRAPWWERGWKWARRRPATAALMAAGTLGLLGLLAGVLAYNAILHRHNQALAAQQQATEQARMAAVNNLRLAQGVVHEFFTGVSQSLE
ncbi:MAG TPA: serine/threonine-protein kinase [Gemmataceae bacterium]|nr:serine/threonine-protein kinase [Gemmataceae bacterium]